MRKPKRLPAVWVRWHDAAKYEGQFSYDIELNPIYMETAGILIRRNKDGVWLARDVYPEERQLREMIHIPAPMIEEIRVFNV